MLPFILYIWTGSSHCFRVMNVQQTIIKGIKEQLFFNNYLVLPGFGGFVLKSRPAHFSASGGLLLPPSKTVSFNAQLKQNDGILAIWLQNKVSCSADEALGHLQDFSGFCTGILNAKRRLSLEGIGFFYLDFENNICFEPQQDSNFLSSSFGLAPVSIKELEPEIAGIKTGSVFIDRRPHIQEAPEKPVKLRNYKKLINPAMFGIILICLLALLVSNSTIKGELRSSVFGENLKGVYTPLSYPELVIAATALKNDTYVADANGIATIDLESEKTLAVKVTGSFLHTGSPISFKPERTTTARRIAKFEIVLGCFTLSSNAKRMVRKLSGQNIRAAISGKNAKGMYVVSNGNFDTKEEALRKLQDLKNNFPHAWIKQGE